MKILNISLLSLAVLIATSCNKQTVTQPNPRNLSSVSLETDPDEIKFDNIMEAAAIGLLDIRSNPSFQAIVNEYVDLQFDDEHEVLFMTLDSVCTANNIDLQEEMVSSLQNHDRDDLVELVPEILHGFSYGLDEAGQGVTLYPQIYIPFATEVDRDAVPSIGINLAEESGTIDGFGADASTITIDAAYASGNTTWVVGANEVVDNFGRKSGHGNVGNKTTATGDNTILIKKVKLTSKKEAFPNGASEICYAMYRQGTGNCNNGGFKSYYLGKVSNSEQSVDDDAIESWIAPLSDRFSPSSTYNQYVHCIWYERDVRKKFKRTENIVPGCSNTQFTYRSKEDKFGIQSSYNNWINNSTYGFDAYMNHGLSGLEVWQKWE